MAATRPSLWACLRPELEVPRMEHLHLLTQEPRILRRGARGHGMTDAILDWSSAAVDTRRVAIAGNG
jgi:hypothetical protein